MNCIPFGDHQERYCPMLPPDDIQVGKFITVFAWKLGTDQNDGSFCGDVLLVKAVSLPYVVIDYLAHGGRVVLSSVVLDIRKVELKELTAEYVDAVLGVHAAVVPS